MGGGGGGKMGVRGELSHVNLSHDLVWGSEPVRVNAGKSNGGWCRGAGGLALQDPFPWLELGQC